MKDLNGKQAAIRAGYAPGSAEVTASQLISNPNVKKRIDELSQKITTKLEITAERVLNELAAIAFVPLDEIVQWDAEGNITFKPSAELTPEARATISEIEQNRTEESGGKGTTREKVKLRIKRNDKLAALNMLGKYLGMFAEKQAEAPAPVQPNVVVFAAGWSDGDSAKFGEYLQKITPTPAQPDTAPDANGP